MGINAAGGHDVTFAREDFGRRTDHEFRRNAVHHARIPGFSDRGDPAVADADVGFSDPRAVDDDDIGDDQIRRTCRPAGRRRLPHAVTNGLAAAEFRFVTVHRGIAFDDDEEIGVGKTNAVAGRRAVVACVGTPVDLHSCTFAKRSSAVRADSRVASASRAPSTRRFRPMTSRAPPIATSSTSTVSPGSNLTAVPDAMFRRMPYAAARSNERQRLTSRKWKWEPTCTGRSPVLATSIRRVGRPALMTMGSLVRRYSPGIMASPYGLRDGDELRAVGKRAFHLDLVDHVGHPFHHGAERKNSRPDAHDLRDRLAVAYELEDLGGDQRNRFRMIELHAAGKSFSRELAGAEDEELFDVTRSQAHDTYLTGHRRSAAHATGRHSCDI